MAIPVAGKIAIEVAKDPDRAIKAGLMLLGAFFATIMLVTIPFMLIFLPAAESETYDQYYEAAESIFADTGIFVDWQEIIALDSVLKEQEIEDVTKSQILREYRNLFVIETTVREETSCGYFDPPERKCYKDVKKYSKRSFDAIIATLHLDDDQIEQVMAILESDLNEMLSDKYQSNFPIGGGGGAAKVSENVLRWKPLVLKYAIVNGIESYVPYILAQIQQESGGTLLDVMQSSESKGLPPNTITDPEYSIQVGVSYFSEVLRAAKYDIKVALQSYNYGIGFVKYALNRGGYTKQIAIDYSRMMAERSGKSGYGDVNYVDNVLRYYLPGATIFDFDSIYQQLREFDGWVYLWGGRRPSQGGFDCSGLLEYVLGKNGIKISGTAADMFVQTAAIDESEAVPGDLVFFKTTETEVSHVGMYIGNGKFYNSNNSHGVTASSLDVWRKLYKFHGFRRIK